MKRGGTSPTFILMRRHALHAGKFNNVYHIDLYRVEEEIDLKTIGIEEFLTENYAVSVIEWPEKIKNKLPAEAIKIKIEVAGANERKIKVAG